MTEGKGILPASSIDRRLIRAAASFDKSPEQLSEAVMGQLTPAQAEERLHQILANITILDEIEQRRILLVQMAEHLAWMKEQRKDPKSWGAINRTFKLVSDQIERTNINVEDINTKLAVDHARMFVDGFMIGFDKAMKVLAERHDEIVIEEEELLELTQVGIETSKEYLEKVTVRASVD